MPTISVDSCFHCGTRTIGSLHVSATTPPFQRTWSWLSETEATLAFDNVRDFFGIAAPTSTEPTTMVEQQRPGTNACGVIAGRHVLRYCGVKINVARDLVTRDAMFRIVENFVAAKRQREAEAEAAAAEAAAATATEKAANSEFSSSEASSSVVSDPGPTRKKSRKAAPVATYGPKIVGKCLPQNPTGTFGCGLRQKVRGFGEAPRSRCL